MKIRNIIAAGFAGFGVYSLLTTLLGGAIAITGIAWSAQTLGPDARPLVFTQYAMWLVPPVIGLILIFCAYWLSGVVLTAARISTDEVLLIESGSLLRVMLVGIGAYLLVTSVSALGRIAYLEFVTKAASRAIATESERSIPDLSEAVAQLVQFVAGFVLIRNVAVIVQWFERRWDAGR